MVAEESIVFKIRCCFIAVLLVGMTIDVNHSFAVQSNQKLDIGDRSFDELTFKIESFFLYGSHHLKIDGTSGKFTFETENIDGAFHHRLTLRQLKQLHKLVKESSFSIELDENLASDEESYFLSLTQKGKTSSLEFSESELTGGIKHLVEFLDQLAIQEESLRDISSAQGYWAARLFLINQDLDRALQPGHYMGAEFLPLGFDRFVPRLKQMARSDDPRLVSRASRALRAIKLIPEDFMGKPIRVAKTIPQGDQLASFNEIWITFQSPAYPKLSIDSDGWLRFEGMHRRLSEAKLKELDDLCKATNYLLDETYEKSASGDSCELAIIRNTRYRKVTCTGPQSSRHYAELIQFAKELVEKYAKNKAGGIRWMEFSEKKFEEAIQKSSPVLVYFIRDGQSDVYQNFEVAMNMPRILQQLNKRNVICFKGNITEDAFPLDKKRNTFKSFRKKNFAGPGLAIFDPSNGKWHQLKSNRSCHIIDNFLDALAQVKTKESEKE